MIEKHFTIDKSLPGRDNKFALDEPELTQMITHIRVAEQCLEDHGSGPRAIEAETMENIEVDGVTRDSSRQPKVHVVVRSYIMKKSGYEAA